MKGTEVPIRIRRMTVEDFPAVYNLGLRCYDVLDKPYNYWTIEEVAHHLEANHRLCYVAEDTAADTRADDSGQVVGFALGDETFEVIKDAGHLEWVAVAPEYRRQGIASSLIARLVQEFRRLGKRTVVTDISSKNDASVAVALKAGFQEGITVTFYVRDLTERQRGAARRKR